MVSFTCADAGFAVWNPWVPEAGNNPPPHDQVCSHLMWKCTMLRKKCILAATAIFLLKSVLMSMHYIPILTPFVLLQIIHKLQWVALFFVGEQKDTFSTDVYQTRGDSPTSLCSNSGMAHASESCCLRVPWHIIMSWLAISFCWSWSKSYEERWQAVITSYVWYIVIQWSFNASILRLKCRHGDKLLKCRSPSACDVQTIIATWS